MATLAASSSFTARRINQTTFVIREDDTYGEHPLIYAKILPRNPLIVLSDTGCDEPSDEHRHDRYTHLREYLEQCPQPANNGMPLNPNGEYHYIIICTHCHYDHIGGIMQFLRGGTTEMVASAAGRDFIESDLESHGLFKSIHRPTPYYHVTKWAQAFERLRWPFEHKASTVASRTTDLGITMFQTVGHTPDELAWYDHEEMHLYVGDSFYREGADGMPIEFPLEGNMIEWIFSMQKLAVFVRTENARAEAASEAAEADDADWVEVPRRVLVSCAHQTTSADGEEILAELEQFSFRVLNKQVPVVSSQERHGVLFDTWRETTQKRTPMSIMAPRQLMEQARDFFGHSR